MKKIITSLLALIICINTSGCYDSKEISRIAFVIAVGFDENSYTFQIVKPSSFDGESSDNSPLLAETISASNVYDAMDKLNSKVAEACDFSHIKIVVFSQKVTENGIKKQIDAMLKSNDFHPNIKIAMCEGKASDYMKDMKIPLNTNPAEYYENLFRYGFTQYSPDTRLKDMQKNYSTHIKGNVIPIINGNKGMAILRNFKLTGTANYHNTLIYNLLKNNGFQGDFTITEDVVVNLKKTVCNSDVIINKNSADIVVNLTLEGNIIWEEENTDIKSVEKRTKEKLEEDIKNLLQKCSTTYKADIFDFYKPAKTQYTTIQSWEKEIWQTIFENATYKVYVDVKIKREGLNIN